MQPVRIEQKGPDVLQFSYVGMQTQEITVGASTTIDVVLQVSQ